MNAKNIAFLRQHLYDHSFSNIMGGEVHLSDHRSKVVLAVNVASRCGYTSHYKGLEELYRKYMDSGFMVVGFPCNQFGQQEPGEANEIADFCTKEYNVSFPITNKIEVKGPGSHPLYQSLTRLAPDILGPDVAWNFTKFLIAPHGSRVLRFAPHITPEELVQPLEAFLDKYVSPR